MATHHSAGELTERILLELQLAAPETEAVVKDRLRQRLLKLLQDSGVPGDTMVEREATLLMVQLRGLDQLTETFSASVAVGVLNRFFGMMGELVLRHQGTIERLLGSAIRAVFGVPRTQNDHVEQAIACAVAMQQAMNQFNRQNEALSLPQCFASVVVHSGPLLAGPLGAYPHREFSVVGTEVEVLSRLQAHSLRGQVLVGENTYRNARDFILVGEDKNLFLPGRKEALKVYELLGTTRPRPMTVPRREQRKSPRVRVAMPCYFQRLIGGETLPTVHSGEVIDLGYHGLQMNCSQLLEPGADLRLELSPFLFGGQTAYLSARVADIESAPEGYRCGLEFLDCEGAGQRAIRQLVDSLVYQG